MVLTDTQRLLLTAALGGRSPFPWQERLLGRMLGNDVPRALDLPTGMGKTSVMAIWLTARALGATQLPRRLVYVVDRRAVVDQATDVAEQLSGWASVGELPDLLGIRHRSRAENLLPVSTLRGQFTDNREWLEDPACPAIVIGTVDMVGSRLLFEGYGCSRKMRPYYAGLLANDTLFVLDEAHLVPPFERLLEGVQDDRFWPDAQGLPARLRILSLSATGRLHSVDAFELDEADRAHPTVSQRLHAHKALYWTDVPAAEKLAEALAEHAWTLAEEAQSPQRIVVFTHRREHAEKALEELVARAKSSRPRGATLPATELLVGARRLRERAAADARLAQLGFVAADTRSPLADHAFLFATSAGEVGIDLDADHAVCDVVPWERMVQRLGRVNRRGQGHAQVRILAQAADGTLDAAQLERIRDLVEALPPLGEAARSGSPHDLGALKKSRPTDVAAASTPSPFYPPLTLPLVEAFSMTSLTEHTGRPEVAPWLRGWIEDEPQTEVVWRAHLPLGDLAELEFEAPPARESRVDRDARLVRRALAERRAVEALTPYFEAFPPHPIERLATETYRVTQWLEASAKRLTAQLDAKRDEPEDPESDAAPTVLGIVLDSAGEPCSVLTLSDLQDMTSRQRDDLVRALAGMQLVVIASLAGLTPEGLLDPKAELAPPTADELGVHDNTATESSNGWSDIKGLPPLRTRAVRTESPATAQVAAGWCNALTVPLRRSKGGEVIEWLVIQTFRGAATSEESRSTSGAQRLDEHQTWVEAEARRLCERLALPADLAQVITRAALLHDEGKRAVCWQEAFSAPTDAVYAKTRGPLRPGRLAGYRHELGSLPYAEQDPVVRALSEADRELALHLVAAHHGGARPVLRTEGVPDLPPQAVRRLAERIAVRFVTLQQRLGPFRLAYLESLLRAADQAASRRHQQPEA